MKTQEKKRYHTYQTEKQKQDARLAPIRTKRILIIRKSISIAQAAGKIGGRYMKRKGDYDYKKQLKIESLIKRPIVE